MEDSSIGEEETSLKPSQEENAEFQDEKEENTEFQDEKEENAEFQDEKEENTEFQDENSSEIENQSEELHDVEQSFMEGLKDNLDATALLNNSPSSATEPNTKKARGQLRRPTSKWILFLSERREVIKREHPEFTFPQIARELALQYKAISPEDNDRLEAVAMKDKARYHEELKNSLLDKEEARGSDVISNTELILPVVRVKRAIKLDPEVKAVAKEAVAVLTKATELFTMYFTKQAMRVVTARGAKQMKDVDTIHAVHATRNLEFLALDFPKSALNKKPRKEREPASTDAVTGIKLNADGQPRKKLGRPSKTPVMTINKYFSKKQSESTATDSTDPVTASAGPAGTSESVTVDIADTEEGGDSGEADIDDAAQSAEIEADEE